MSSPRRDARLARRRHLLIERLATAKTPHDRLNATLAYLRAMLKDAPPDRAAATAEVLADIIVTHADHLAEGNKP